MVEIVRNYSLHPYYEYGQASSIRFAPVLKLNEDTFEELWYPVSCRDKCQDIPRIMKYNTCAPIMHGFRYKVNKIVEEYQDENFYFHLTFQYKKELDLFLKQYWIINDYEDLIGFNHSTNLITNKMYYKDSRCGYERSNNLYSVILTMDRGWINSPFTMSCLTFLLRLISYITFSSSDKKVMMEEVDNHWENFRNSDGDLTLEGNDNELVPYFRDTDVIDIIKNIDIYSFGAPITYLDDDKVAEAYKEVFVEEDIIYPRKNNLTEYFKELGIIPNKGLNNNIKPWKHTAYLQHSCSGFHAIATAVYALNDNMYGNYDCDLHVNNLVIGLCLKNEGIFNE